MSKRSTEPERPSAVDRRRRSKLPVIGWREWVDLPELHVDPIKAKVDTGARSSCMHAFDLEWFERQDETWVRFEVHPIQRSDRGAQQVECRVHAIRTVRSSNGKTERRPVIRTAIELDGEEYHIDVTLTRRDQMGFRMLLGREAVRGRFLIHAGRSFLLGRPESGDGPVPRRTVKKSAKKTLKKTVRKSSAREAAAGPPPRRKSSGAAPPSPTKKPGKRSAR